MAQAPCGRTLPPPPIEKKPVRAHVMAQPQSMADTVREQPGPNATGPKTAAVAALVAAVSDLPAFAAPKMSRSEGGQSLALVLLATYLIAAIAWKRLTWSQLTVFTLGWIAAVSTVGLALLVASALNS